MRATSKGVQALTAEDILRYFLGSDDQLDTCIMCKTDEQSLITTDRDLYEALGSIKSYDNFSLPRLVKLLERVAIRAAEKPLLTHERVEALRKNALSGRYTP